MLEQKTPAIKEAFTQRFDKAIAEGWIPEAARANLARMVDIRFMVDDGLNTIMQGLDAATSNHEGHDRTVIHFQPNLADDAHVQTHELLHAVSGASAAKGAFDHFGLVRLFGQGHGGQQMDEAIVEHLAGSMINGNVNTVDPAHRERAPYENARGLLSELVEGGVKPVDIRLFSNAYFENDSNEAQSRLWVALRRAFPFTNVLEEIEAIEASDESTDKGSVYAYEHELRERTAKYKRGGGRGRLSAFLNR